MVFNLNIYFCTDGSVFLLNYRIWLCKAKKKNIAFTALTNDGYVFFLLLKDMGKPMVTFGVLGFGKVK